MNDYTIGREIERRMLAAGLNRKQLSLKAGLGATYVRDIIIGKSKHPRKESVQKLADALGCRPFDLYRETEINSLNLTEPLEKNEKETITIGISQSIAELKSAMGDKHGEEAFSFFNEAFSKWIDIVGGDNKLEPRQYRLLSNTISMAFSFPLRSARTPDLLLMPALLLIDALYTITSTTEDSNLPDIMFKRYISILRSLANAKKAEDGITTTEG